MLFLHQFLFVFMYYVYCISLVIFLICFLPLCSLFWPCTGLLLLSSHMLYEKNMLLNWIPRMLWEVVIAIHFFLTCLENKFVSIAFFINLIIQVSTNTPATQLLSPPNFIGGQPRHQTACGMFNHGFIHYLCTMIKSMIYHIQSYAIFILQSLVPIGLNDKLLLNAMLWFNIIVYPILI